MYVKGNKNKIISYWNTAKNMLEEGKQIIGLSSPEFKRVGEQAVASSVNLEKHVRY